MVKLGIDRRCCDTDGHPLRVGDRVLILQVNREAVVSDRDANFDVVWLNDERWSYDTCSLRRLPKSFAIQN